MLNKSCENLYNILEIDSNSNQNDIKQAFRRLSLKFHPDKEKNFNNGEKYKSILMAYEILIDPVKKEIYDNKIDNKVYNKIDNKVDNKIDNKIDNNSNNIINKEKEENFNNFIPETIIKELFITLDDAFRGGMIPIEIDKYNYYWGNISYEREKIYIEIPKGIDDNEIILIKNKGNIYNNIVIGDIKIQIKIRKHIEYLRDGLDLILNKNISLKESLCGFKFEINHLNEKKYIIQNNGESVIKYNEKKIINNLGMDRNNYKGNLIIIFNIIYPNMLSSEQISKLKDIL
tara:strand:- start:7220 stop:8083 length:864 start_codon:yes stop_codon:yes gene_type:complete